MITDAQSYLKLAFTGVGNYAYSMVCRDEAHLSIYHIESKGSSTKLLTTQYSVTLGTGGIGGTVAVSDASLTAGFLFIKREVPLSQTINLTNSGRLDMELLERGLDTNVMLIQQIRDYVATSTVDIPWRGEWSGPDVGYYTRDLTVAPDGDWYICQETHQSSASFSTDLTAGMWLLWIPMSSYADLTTRVTELETNLDYDEIGGSFGIDITGNAATATSADTTTSADTATIADSCPTAAPPGAVMLFARSTPPTGWLKANGAAISRTAYADLFAAIGVIAGEGDGSTTFNVPDGRGEFFRGWDDSRGVDSGRVLCSGQAGTNHPNLSVHAYSSTAGVLVTPTVNSYPSFPSGNYQTEFDSIQSTTDGGYLSVNLAVSGSAASGRYYTSRPRNVAFLACIKY